MAEPIVISSSVDAEAGNGDSGASISGSFSGDGTKLVFFSYASNLVQGDTNGAADIFVKDLVTGGVTLVSRAADGTIGDGNSTEAVFSADGTKVVFTSAADNLVAGDTNGASDFFVKDLSTGSLARVVPTYNGQPLQGVSAITLSPDGTKIAFLAGDPKDVYLADVATGQSTLISVGGQGTGWYATHEESAQPVFSPDGTKLAFVSLAADLVAGDDNLATDVFVKDLSTGTLTLVSTNAAGAESKASLASEISLVPAFSPDGTMIAFVSSEYNLVPGDTNGGDDVFVKDLATGAITRISVNAEGAQAGQASFGDPVFMDGGDTVVFMSNATNLIVDETHNQPGLYAKDLVTGLVTLVATNVGAWGHISASPDGSKIVYEWKDEHGIEQIYSLPFEVAPHGKDDSYKGGYDAPLAVDAANGVLANDTDLNGDALTAELVSGPAHGRIKLNADGSFTYTPSGTYVGEDTFVYHAYDGHKYSGDTTVTIKVTGNIERMSTTSGDAQAEDGAIFDTPAFSPDGKYLAFTTTSTDLYGNNTPFSQVLLKNLKTGEITVVSETAGGTLSTEDNATQPTFSPDGTKIAFTSGSFDTTGIGGIVVKDLKTGSLTVVSTAADGTEGNNFSQLAKFSPDGGEILFYSASNNLVAGDTNDVADFFTKNLTTGAITRVTTAADGSQANDGSSFASFSPDGKSVVFMSYASNLVAGDTNNTGDIFIKNLETGAVTLVSHGLNGGVGSSGSDTPVFSPDGKYVAFSSAAGNLVAGDTNGTWDVFVENIATGAITRVSTASDGSQVTETHNAMMQFPVFSPDGTRIAFVSSATGIAPGASGAGDIVEKNLVTGAVRLVSTDAFESPGNGWSSRPAYSADGKLIAFYSQDTNLIPGDSNGVGDIYVKDLTKFPIGTHQTNTAPAAVSDRYAIAADETLSVKAAGVLANDTDAEQNRLTAVLVKGPKHGDLTLKADGSFKYIPDETYSGKDSFTYRANDGALDSGTATVTIKVKPATTIHSSTTLTLPDGVLNLVLTGKKDIDGTGNGLGNSVSGNSGDNSLNGGAGGDTLYGAGGLDHLKGGKGDDLFVFKHITDSGKTLAKADVIADFKHGNDHIDLTAMDGNSGKGGIQHFKFVDKDHFTAAGQVRAEVHGHDTLVLLNTDSDKAAEMAILVNGTTHLVASDFDL